MALSSLKLQDHLVSNTTLAGDRSMSRACQGADNNEQDGEKQRRVYHYHLSSLYAFAHPLWCLQHALQTSMTHSAPQTPRVHADPAADPLINPPGPRLCLCTL
jgi:hypothetical protein